MVVINCNIVTIMCYYDIYDEVLSPGKTWNIQICMNVQLDVTIYRFILET
jgi:hypothetical protein